MLHHIRDQSWNDFFFLNCELANLLIELLVNFVDFVYFLTFEVVYIVVIVSPCLL